MGDYTKRFQKREDPQAQSIKLLDKIVRGNTEELIDYFAHERPESFGIMATVLVENPNGQKTIARLLTSAATIARENALPKLQLEEMLRSTGEAVLLHASFAEGNSVASHKANKLAADLHTKNQEANKMAADLNKKNQENEQLKDKYFKLAYLDPLTGIENRLAFMDKIQQFHREASNYPDQIAEAYTMIHVDLDHFKEANDTYGHPAGDKALMTFVERVRSTMLAEEHPNDVFTRFGGDEFAFLLPRTTERGGQKLSERILALMKALPVHFHNHTFPIGASIGVWQYQPGDTVDDVITAADNCMYIAKHAYGGNQVITGTIAASDVKEDTEKAKIMRQKCSPAFQERLLRYSSEPNKV